MVKANREQLIANMTFGLKSSDDQKTTKRANETLPRDVKKTKRSIAGQSVSSSLKAEDDLAIEERLAVLKNNQMSKVPVAPPKVERSFKKRGIKPTSKEFCDDTSSSSGDEKAAKEKQEQLIANMAITLNNAHQKPKQRQNKSLSQKKEKALKDC